MSLPFVLKVMPYRIKFFSESGDFAEAIVLGKNMVDAIEILMKENRSIDNVTNIEKVELIRLQESGVLTVQYK